MSSTRTPLIDWTGMTRADFDDRAPLNLVDVDAVSRPIPAAPDACGTEALFGEQVEPKRSARPAKAAVRPAPEPDTLF